MCGASLHDNCGLPLLGEPSTASPRGVICRAGVPLCPLLAAIDAALIDLRFSLARRAKDPILPALESAETDPRREVSLSIVRRGVVSTRPR